MYGWGLDLKEEVTSRGHPANTTRHVILSVDVVTSFAVIAAVGSRHPCGLIFSLLDSTFRYTGVYTAVAVNAVMQSCRQNYLYILVYMGKGGHCDCMTAF